MGVKIALEMAILVSQSVGPPLWSSRVECNPSTIIGWIVLTFCEGIRGPHTLDPGDHPGLMIP